MVKEKIEVSYIYCPDQNCLSKKQRVLLIEYNKEGSTINLLCMDCGQLSFLSMPGLVLPKLKAAEGKKEPTYLG